jgi:vacuolar-type H+-ATPase subunit I/STV1
MADIDQSFTVSRDIKFHDTNEIKTNISQYNHLNQEIKDLQSRMKQLRMKKESLNSVLKNFMKFNEIRTCHLSNSSVKKMDFVERINKQSLTVGLIRQELEHFFDDTDPEKFTLLSSKQKSDLIFEYLNSKRPSKTSESIIIKKS